MGSYQVLLQYAAWEKNRAETWPMADESNSELRFQENHLFSLPFLVGNILHFHFVPFS